ncbi:hypothetical protein ACFWIA_16585 [Streptomyces sp. NPDC127068]|uniref:hypothetical protein n=1 Tax=Streptomyces sp. NPDC127068 TaxID=3347127 RepID=UPI003667D66C
MSLTQQYALDLYRARRREEPLPPAPGRHDWRTLGEFREFSRLRRGRPARGRWWRTLLRTVR